MRLTRAQITVPGRRPARSTSATAASSATSASPASAKAPTPSCAKRSKRSRREGAEGIVLDLRGNGGGLLQEAVLTASIFLPKDEVVVTTDPAPRGDADYKTVGDNLPQLPLVVLIDRNTASAAEILTAALADDAGADGRRHPLLRQGRLPAGGRPLQRRRPEADDRRVLHARRVNLAGKGIHPDVQRRDDPRTETRRGAASARSGSWPVEKRQG